MLLANVDRVLAMVGREDRVLDVGGWAAPFNPATHVLDIKPYETRGPLGSFGPLPERFGPATWVRRDFCDREPWPWPDGFFDFSLCVMTLEDVRDPLWVCSELSRVSRRGYVETPSVVHELTYNVQGRGRWLGFDHHRWLVLERGGGLEFLHKSHSLHDEPRVRVSPRWAARLSEDDRITALFWEGELRARERVHVDEPYPVGELEAMVREVCRPSAAELRAREVKERAAHAGRRLARPLRRAAERAVAGR